MQILDVPNVVGPLGLEALRDQAAAPAHPELPPALVALELAPPAPARPAGPGCPRVLRRRAAVRLSWEWHLQYLALHEGVEAVGILPGSERGDAIRLATLAGQVVVDSEHPVLRPPAPRVALQDVDDSEEIHLLPVDAGEATCFPQLSYLLFSLGWRAISRQPVDPDEQGVIQEALVGQKLRVCSHHICQPLLVGRIDIHAHGCVHPLPVPQSAITRSVLRCVLGGSEQDIGCQGSPVGRGTLEVEDHPHLHW
mmetsp:Transcript_24379/g.69519  ORF Transcript_24379/g.69519 Transcript_24379/m.69519 type:complete len:253 (-) Transcript_24379:1937-2695(-)